MKMIRYIILCSVLCAGSALAQGIIYSDSFTGADGAAIDGRAPEVTNGVSGATWARHDGFWELDIQGNKARLGASQAISLDIASSGGYVEPEVITVSATLNTGSFTTENGIYTRGVGIGFYSSLGGGAPNNDWHGLMLDANGSLVLSQPGAGGFVPVTVIASNITTGVDHTLSYQVDTLTADISNIYLDGILQPDVTTGLFGPGGRVGIAASSSTGSTYAYADDFFVGAGAPPVPFPTIADPAVNLIANGDFLLSANEDDTLKPGATQFNVNGTFGDYIDHEKRTADVVDWAPFYADPNDLVLAVGTPHLVNGDGELDGTWYLDTLIDTNVHLMLLNSSMNYRNGMKQEDILNGVTINPSTTYTLAVDASYTDFGSDYSTSPFTVALTDGSGVAVTNPANTIAGSQLTGDVAFWNGSLRSTAVSGADLLAAGQVNVIFDIESSFVIPGFPGGAPNPNNLALVAQARVFEVSLIEVFVQQLGDVNKDGQVTQDDVTLANSYLDGSIDGLDDAATRQAAWIGYGLTGAEALDILNLTQFDIDGNDTFDAADVTALQALVVPLSILSTTLDGSSMTVEVGGLAVGTGYSLMKDADLGSAPSFDVIADSITAASQTETLTDTNAVEGQAFYKIMKQ